MKKFGIIALVLAVMLVFVPCVMAYGVKQDICSDWAKLYVRDARSVYDLTPWEAEVQDLTVPATSAQFIDYVNRTCAHLKERYDRHDLADVEPLSFEIPAGDKVSREQAALYLVRAAQHFLLPMHMPALIEFADASAASAEYADALDTACRMGLFLGDENGNLEPHRAVTREEAIALCIRLLAIAPWYKMTVGRTFRVDGLYTDGNSFMFWIENEAGEVLRVWPHEYGTYGYRDGWGVEYKWFETVGGRLMMIFQGNLSPDAERALYFCDPVSGEVFLTMPSRMYFYSLSADGQYLILRENRMSGETWDFGHDVFGVFDLTGAEIVPMGASREALVSAGYLHP
ncbi:MAG: S-layer homology domain-containing protein [Ruminococcaceae bacterium]|nr:S-layer homology domain-containing protein [Oscillospiraceae bacterium]